ncbi:EAL domain-containing protein [Myxococcota bacterium]|nr:EAL domain-containing protein [Myxococcota bacterium]
MIDTIELAPREARRVLVLDPRACLAGPFSQALSDEGVAVEATQTAEDAADRLDRGSYDAVVVELVGRPGRVDLPGLLRVRHPTVPLILVGEPWSVHVALRWVGDGAVAIVRRPEDPRQVLQAWLRARDLRARRVVARDRMMQEYVRTRHREALDRVFDQALAHLYLIFQPIIRASNGAVIGYEALVRTTGRRFVGAAPVVDLALSLAREIDLDDRVRALVSGEFEEKANWHTLFVNLDPGELTRGLLGSDKDPLWPFATRIVVEFGRELPAMDGPVVQATLERMRAAGYRIAAGDISIHNDSLVRMRVLEPDIYKLGVEVVRDCHRDPRRQRFIAEFVALAHDEGALVVAQGIEQAEERQAVVELGCDLVQGFLLGMPRPGLDH